MIWKFRSDLIAELYLRNTNNTCRIQNEMSLFVLNNFRGKISILGDCVLHCICWNEDDLIGYITFPATFYI
jgi:hypothetical protein